MSRTAARLRSLNVHLRTRGLATAATRPPLSGLSTNARERAEKLSAGWKGTSATGGNTKLFIGGEFIESKTSEWIDLADPVCFTSASLSYRSS
jgi:malonate-semialdehyde dehydrogenase (acetylating) / methylmalonate-semialdehyde dehydrogenase